MHTGKTAGWGRCVRAGYDWSWSRNNIRQYLSGPNSECPLFSPCQGSLSPSILSNLKFVQTKVVQKQEVTSPCHQVFRFCQFKNKNIWNVPFSEMLLVFSFVIVLSEMCFYFCSCVLHLGFTVHDPPHTSSRSTEIFYTVGSQTRVIASSGFTSLRVRSGSNIQKGVNATCTATQRMPESSSEPQEHAWKISQLPELLTPVLSWFRELHSVRLRADVIWPRSSKDVHPTRSPTHTWTYLSSPETINPPVTIWQTINFCMSKSPRVRLCVSGVRM